MIRVLLILLALSVSAQAEVARVLSGEHGDFTRLVIELPRPESWTLGRTETGYAFAIETRDQLDYDLSRVWQRISRARLGALAQDTQRGALELALTCDCHVFPFEYGPGIVVLDIKPGPAPAGSSFETAFTSPATAGPAVEVDPLQAYDWLADRSTGADFRTGDPSALPLPLATGAVSLEPLRNALLQQIALGAVDGIVDMELPGKPRKGHDTDQTALPWSNIHLGEQPGILVSETGSRAEGSRPQSSCADPALLDLPAWSSDSSPYDLLAEARTGLYGEFDAPEPEAMLHAVRGLLYLGFGAEARQTIALLGNGRPGDAAALYASMGLLVDGESDPQTPFASMLDCDGPAALWAALARDRLPPGPGANRDAILQAFVALPAHLRRHLGPELAEKFLSRDDPEAARMIRDAMDRAPDADKTAITLLDARAALQNGDVAAAQVLAGKAVAADGDRAESLIALVETHFRTLDPLTSDTTEALLSLRAETEGAAEGPAIRRAIILGLALSGQTGAAFREPAVAGETLADLWRVVVARAPDDDFLVHAVLPATATAPEVAPEIRLSVAGRLLSLGFPDAALAWLGPVTLADAPEWRLVTARARLMQGDARSGIDLLEGMDSAEAGALRATALVQLGDIAAAEEAMTAAGEAEAAVRMEPWKGDWANLDPALPEPWRQAAASVAASPGTEPRGLLGKGHEAIEASLASRTAIEALLSSVASPVTD
ncbi:MAG: hypothetical protein J0L76_11640 [Rhodobacterales bacterium]|nr:hypothetical protein [Rhodobacterales bacterium]